MICGIWDHLAAHMSVARAKQDGTAPDSAATAENIASADGESCSNNDENPATVGRADAPRSSGKNILEKTAVLLVDSERKVGAAIRALLGSDEADVLGMDLEWKVNVNYFSAEQPSPPHPLHFILVPSCPPPPDPSPPPIPAP